jgi:hypothetical protein
MLPSFSRGLRLALVLALGAGFVAWQGHGHRAFAAPDDEEEADDSSDDSKDAVSDEGDDPDDKDQPPITAGGLFTMNTYPVREMFRPLTMTEHITQIRLGLGTDISAKGAFGTFGLSGEAQYGVSDNFMVIGGITNAYNFKQFGVYAGFEGALMYDLVDVRLAANLHRSAIARYCDSDPEPPANCMDPTMPGVLPNLPDGNYDAGGTKFSIDIGFPFRYSIKPEIAIVALQTLMSIDFNKVDRDHVASATINENGMMVTRTVAVPNGVKPDLNVSAGLATNPIAALSVVVFGQLRIPDFDTSAGNFQIPVTGRVEFSPNQKLDIGLEFTLLNVKPPKDQSPIDNRFISLFVQSRFGK